MTIEDRVHLARIHGRSLSARWGRPDLVDEAESVLVLPAAPAGSVFPHANEKRVASARLEKARRGILNFFTVLIVVYTHGAWQLQWPDYDFFVPADPMDGCSGQEGPATQPRALIGFRNASDPAWNR